MKDLLSSVKSAHKTLITLGKLEVNKCLLNIKNELINNVDLIVKENKKDIDNAIINGLSSAMIERLTLNKDRIISIASSIDDIISLPHYIGEVIEKYRRGNGIEIKKVRVPFGVVCAIFESRPNVCVDIAVLCLKTNNACVLKGGKEAIHSNTVLVKLIQNAIGNIIDPKCVTLIESTDRSITDELIKQKGLIDLLIPRGSKRLIDYIVSNAKIPFIETGAGNCHLYVDKDADINMAIKVAINAKYQRPSVCNAIENLLVDEKIANKFLPLLYEEFKKLNIEMRGCDKTLKIININKATDDDFYTEYNDYIISIKVVNGVLDAISHINEHSSKHSEAIITNNDLTAVKFLNEIDSACVYHNASTRFTDGGEFGFGAEIGISTAKLHARGPMGLKEITTYKYMISGNGQVR